MPTLLTHDFVRRLRALRERLAKVLRHRAVAHTSASGPVATPEVDSYREYSPGDDLRYVDWNLYARLDRFYVKSLVREEESTVHLCVDTSASMREPFPAKFERALQVCAGIAYAALGAGSRVAVSAWSDRLLRRGATLQGETSCLPLLRSLEELPLGHRTDLARSLASLSHSGSLGGASVVLVSDFLTAGAYDAAIDHLLSRGVKLSALQVLHRDEFRLRARGSLLLCDPESDEALPTVLGYRRAREAERGLHVLAEGVGRFFRRRGCRCLRVDAQRPFEESVIDYFVPAAGGR